MKATEAMTRTLVTIPPTALLYDAWTLMRERDIRHLLVLDGEQLVGILSDRDVLSRSKLHKSELEVPGLPLSEVMAEEVLSCTPTQSIASIAETMLQHKIDALPVVSDREGLVGLITSSDLLALLAGGKFHEQPLTSLPYAIELVDWQKYTLDDLTRAGAAA